MAPGAGGRRRAGVEVLQYYPTVELGRSIVRQKVALTGGATALQTTYGPSASLTWLLLDFGGRSADVEEARRALYAADYEHNAAIQTVALAIAQSYYQYLNAKALKSAAQASLKAAHESLASAQERHRAGVATIADELQAKTVYSQTELVLQSVEGGSRPFAAPRDGDRRSGQHPGRGGRSPSTWTWTSRRPWTR
jgi:outer membrane protein TolC